MPVCKRSVAKHVCYQLVVINNHCRARMQWGKFRWKRHPLIRWYYRHRYYQYSLGVSQDWFDWLVASGAAKPVAGAFHATFRGCRARVQVFED